jgi:hypothetical protein
MDLIFEEKTTRLQTISGRVVSRIFFLAVRAGTAFRNLFEGTNFQKSKNKDNTVYGDEEIRTLASKISAE